jgi:hypothetical protein
LAWAVDTRLVLIFAQSDPAKGLAAAKGLAKELEADHPDAAASMRERLDDVFTVPLSRRPRHLGRGTDHHQLHRVHDLDCQADDPTNHEAEGRLDEEALGRRRNARSRLLVPAGARLRRHGHVRRCTSSRVHAGSCYTRSVRSGSSLNTLWPPLNFNNERGNVRTYFQPTKGQLVSVH